MTSFIFSPTSVMPAGWRRRKQGQEPADGYLCPGCCHLTLAEPVGFSWGKALEHRRTCPEPVPYTTYNYPVPVVRT